MTKNLTLLLTILCLLCSCGSVYNETVNEHVQSISEQQLMEHVKAFMKIGPRPTSDTKATQKSIDYIETTLKSYGLKPIRELVYSETGRR